MKKCKSDFAATFAELTARTTHVRMAMRAALDKVLPGPSGARACGRALGLRRSLGWQVYALANAAAAATVLRALPRAQGWDLIYQALRKAGCADAELDALRREAKALESFLHSTQLDRDMLRAVAVGGLDSALERQSILRARRSATVANERIFGISAHSTVASMIFGPSGEDGRFDIASATVFHEIKRVRAGSPWPIYQSAETSDIRGGPIRTARRTAGDRCMAPFIEEISTPGIAKEALRMTRRGSSVLFELLDRGDERFQGVQLCFLEKIPGGGSGKPGEPWEIHHSTNLPIRYAAFEVWIHGSHRLETMPSAALVGSPRVFGTLPEPPENLRLPLEIDAEPIDSAKLPTALRACSTAYAGLLSRGFAEMGLDSFEFRGFRVVVRDPPPHCRVVLFWQM